jgi:hypothetical protein
VRRYVVDAPPCVPNLAAIAQRFDVLGSCSYRHSDYLMPSDDPRSL